MRLTHYRIPLIIGTEYLVGIEDWDKEAGLIKTNRKLPINIKRTNNKLTSDRLKAEEIIDLLTATGKIENLTPTVLKIRILKRTTRVTFREFNQKIIDELKLAKKLGNAGCYEQAQSFLDRYAKEKELTFEDINFRLLKYLEAQHLSKGFSLNSLSFYLRTLRATSEKLTSAKQKNNEPSSRDLAIKDNLKRISLHTSRCFEGLQNDTYFCKNY